MRDARTPAPPALTGSDRIALWAVAGISFVVAAAWVVVAITRAVAPYVFSQPVGAELLPLDGRTDTRSVDGVTNSLAGAETVSVSADAFSAGPIAQIVATSALEALIISVVAAILGITIVRIGQGRPFQRLLYRLGITAGGAMAIGGLIVELLGGGGRMAIASEINARLGDERFITGFTIDPALIAMGFAVIALATVFLLGERLQRDTEGLV